MRNDTVSIIRLAFGCTGLCCEAVIYRFCNCGMFVYLRGVASSVWLRYVKLVYLWFMKWLET